MRYIAFAAAVTLGIIESAYASPITVNNFSFEDLVLTCSPGPGCFAEEDIPGWVISGAAATFKPSTGPGGEFNSIPNGVNVAAVGNGTGASNIFQTLTATVQASTLYTLNVSVGQRADFPFSDYTIDLEAGGTVLASDSSLSPAPGTFLVDTITFSSGPAPPTLGDQLGIRLSATGLSATGAAAQADFDLVLLDASAVPAPPPSNLAGLAVLALAFLWRRRREILGLAQ